MGIASACEVARWEYRISGAKGRCTSGRPGRKGQGQGSRVSAGKPMVFLVLCGPTGLRAQRVHVDASVGCVREGVCVVCADVPMCGGEGGGIERVLASIRRTRNGQQLARVQGYGWGSLGQGKAA